MSLLSRIADLELALRSQRPMPGNGIRIETSAAGSRIHRRREAAASLVGEPPFVSIGYDADTETFSITVQSGIYIESDADEVIPSPPSPTATFTLNPPSQDKNHLAIAILPTPIVDGIDGDLLRWGITASNSVADHIALAADSFTARTMLIYGTGYVPVRAAAPLYVVRIYHDGTYLIIRDGYRAVNASRFGGNNIIWEQAANFSLFMSSPTGAAGISIPLPADLDSTLKLAYDYDTNATSLLIDGDPPPANGWTHSLGRVSTNSDRKVVELGLSRSLANGPGIFGFSGAFEVLSDVAVNFETETVTKTYDYVAIQNGIVTEYQENV